MVRATSLANLVPYRAGPDWRGNAKGRPKGRTLTEILREVLDGTELCGQDVPGGRTVAEALVEATLAHAIKGDASLIREVIARIDGRLPDPEPPGGDAGRPMTIRVEYADDEPPTVGVADPDDPPAEAAPGPADDPPGDGAV